jgi:hypothetical protein
MPIPSAHMARRLSCVALIALLLAVICPAMSPLPAQALVEATLEGQPALEVLNEQRTANGSPPLSLNQSLAASWCPNEDEGPGSTEVRRDLSGNGDWGRGYSPWDAAPFHQFSEYSPVFTEAGIVNSGMEASEGCLGLSGASPEPATPTFYAFVSDMGPGDVWPSETVSEEGPFAPQEVVGVPQGTTTGPQLLLYARGMSGEVPYFSNQVHALSWSLTRASGLPVPGARLVDEAAMGSAGAPFSKCAGLLAGGGILIPPPLVPGGYSLSVTWEGAYGAVATQSLSFTVVRQEWERAYVAPTPHTPHAKGHKPRHNRPERRHHKAHHERPRHPRRRSRA